MKIRSEKTNPEKPVFVPTILDLTAPVVFDPEIDFKGVGARLPAPDMLSSPWYAYSQRTMSMFYAHGVRDDMITFFARALEEAYQMGQHGLSPLPTGTPKPSPGYTIHGAVAPQVIQHHFDPLAGSKVRQESPQEPKVPTRSTPIDRRKEPNRAAIRRVARATGSMPELVPKPPRARIIRHK